MTHRTSCAYIRVEDTQAVSVGLTSERLNGYRDVFLLRWHLEYRTFRPWYCDFSRVLCLLFTLAFYILFAKVRLLQAETRLTMSPKVFVYMLNEMEFMEAQVFWHFGSEYGHLQAALRSKWSNVSCS